MIPLYNRGHEKAHFFPIFQKFFEIFQIFTISIETEAKGTILYLLYRKIVNKSIVSKEGKKEAVSES